MSIVSGDSHYVQEERPSVSERPRRPTRAPPPAPIDVDVTTQPQIYETDIQVQNERDPDNPGRLVASPVDAHKDAKEKTAEDQRLTPLRAHYLKKTLIQLQFGRELEGISTASTMPTVSTLSYLGPPFNPPPRGAPPLDLPFLKYIFRQFVITFPFLASAPKDFFPEKLQPFFASLLSRNLAPTNVMDEGSEDMELATRQKVLAKMEKQFGLLLGSAAKLVEPEEVVRLTQADLSRLEAIAKKRRARQLKNQDKFEVNIVCIRAAITKGRVRSKVHEEFVIRTRRTGFPDTFVSRRYGDFKTLADELHKRHPDEMIRPPPAKDRTTVTTSIPSPTAMSSSPTTTRFPGAMSASQSNDSQESVYSLNTQQAIQNIRLSREKNRLTLRAYLHSLMNSLALVSSPVLRHFLLSNPTRLSRDEEEDARRREEADRKREEGRIHFAHEIAARVEGLRSAIRGVKGDIMGQDGLTRIFGIIRVTENVRDLPSEYQAVIEWGRITLASTIFHHFVAADDASETFASMKRLHGLMPYFVLKGILRISNPVAMIRGILDLFLAQPFGGRSLLQRMFTSSLQEEVKALEEDIAAVKEKVEDDMICEKLRQFVYAPREIQSIYKADAELEKLNLLTVVLRSGEEPTLNRMQMHRVMRAHRAHAEYVQQRADLADSDDDDGPQDEDAWLYEDLTILAKLYSQLRDKEQLIELFFEGTTSDLLKDIITIFYAPLAQVYKAASIADSLGDLQNFINDLIRTVEAVEEIGQDDPHRVVQIFIDLVARHEQSFYSFVHKVHSKGEGLFDGLMNWIQSFLTVVRDGLGQRISLEYLLPHSGQERLNVMAEIDAVALYHYKLKLAHEDKLRRRFGRTQGGAVSDADAEDEATQVLVNGVVHDLSFGELLTGDVEDIAAVEDEEDSDEEEEEEESSEDGSSEYETATESDSEGDSEEDSDMPPPPPPKPVARASTISHPPASACHLVNQQHHPRPSGHTRDHRGRDQGQDSAAGETRTLRSRSRSRSIAALKSMFGKNSLDAPPVPPLPNGNGNANYSGMPFSPLSKPLPASPLSARSSQENQQTPRRRRPPPLRRSPAKKKRAGLDLKAPELRHIPNLLPIFVEIMRPLLRPSTQR